MSSKPETSLGMGLVKAPCPKAPGRKESTFRQKQEKVGRSWSKVKTIHWIKPPANANVVDFIPPEADTNFAGKGEVNIFLKLVACLGARIEL